MSNLHLPEDERRIWSRNALADYNRLKDHNGGEALFDSVPEFVRDARRFLEGLKRKEASAQRRARTEEAQMVKKKLLGRTLRLDLIRLDAEYRRYAEILKNPEVVHRKRYHAEAKIIEVYEKIESCDPDLIENGVWAKLPEVVYNAYDMVFERRKRWPTKVPKRNKAPANV